LQASNQARGLAFCGLASMQLVHAFVSRSITDTMFSTVRIGFSSCPCFYRSVPVSLLSHYADFSRLQDLWANKWLIGGVAISFALLCFGCYTPGLRDILQQYPLTGRDWGKSTLPRCVSLLSAHVDACFFPQLLLLWSFTWRLWSF
jgi:hypothetical protein